MKRIGLLCLALVLALGTLGIGYAMWFDTVTIEGTAETASLDLSFDWAEPPIASEFYWEDGRLVLGEYLGKEVASTEAWYSDEETNIVTDKKGHETLNILVDNAYPGYIARVTFLLHNIGSVPLDVVRYEMSGEKRENDGTFICHLLWGPVGLGHWQSVYEDLNGNGIIDDDPEVILFRITDSLPVQVDPCFTEKREIDLEFLQPLQQNKTYVFTVDVVAEQWAE